MRLHPLIPDLFEEVEALIPLQAGTLPPASFEAWRGVPPTTGPKMTQKCAVLYKGFKRNLAEELC